MKKLSLIALGILIVAQLAVPFSMIKSRENILCNGELFRFKTRPIDPADPFQGRYVRLRFEKDHILCSKDEQSELAHRQPLYAIIETGSDDFAYFTGWSLTRPLTGTYLKTHYRWNYTVRDPATKKMALKGIRIHMPFDRFYMEETKAPRAEKLAREATRNTNCWANVRILYGEAVIEDVFAEGQSLRDLAEKEVD